MFFVVMYLLVLQLKRAYVWIFQSLFASHEVDLDCNFCTKISTIVQLCSLPANKSNSNIQPTDQMLCYNELVLNEFHKYTLFFLRWFLIFMTDFGVFLFCALVLTTNFCFTWVGWFVVVLCKALGTTTHSPSTLLSKSPLWLFRFSWNILPFSNYLFNFLFNSFELISVNVRFFLM